MAAKSIQDRDKLPGTIYSVAKEIEALGGEALPIQVDVREPDQLHAMAAKTRERFGRIDVLVNNAGALWWQPLLETPLKRYELVMQVNARAAFVACQEVLPSMIAQGWGHVINVSPPINAEIVPGRIAYCMSKFGVTLLTLGLAQEMRAHNVAVNSLWPVTIIESQASINHQMGTPDNWRKPDVMVDAMLGMLQKEPRSFSGNVLLDEDFLRSEGVTDFGKYACVPGTNPARIKW